MTDAAAAASDGLPPDVLEQVVDAVVLSGAGARTSTRAAQRTRSGAYRAVIRRVGERRRSTAERRAPGGGSLDPRWAAALAEVLVAQQTRTTDLSEAAELLRTAHATAPRALRPDQHALLADTLLALGDHDALRDLLPRLRGLPPRRRRLLEADLANPFGIEGATVTDADEQRWLAHLDAALAPLPPVALLPARPGTTPFDRLTAARRPEPSPDGPLVSVVVSSYRPTHGLATAVRSILDQSWTALEVLVVDDASGPEFSTIYRDVASLDPRVRVLQQDENQGTYAARNRAIAEARGHYVTFQDSDDWSHPERVASQVAVLEADPLVHSTRTMALRLSDTLTASRVGNPPETVAAVTLMFRRDQVMDVLGGFDPVRKAADTEFHRRLEIALPGRSETLDEPLLLARTGAGSLSRDEFAPGWRHPARLAYESASTHWHEAIRSGESPRIEPGGPRPFPAPARYLAARADGPRRRDLDLVVIADWRDDDPVARDAADLAALLAAGSAHRPPRVGVLHVERPSADGQPPREYLEPLRRLVSLEQVEVVTFDEDVDVPLAVVVDPACLSVLPSTPAGLRTGLAVVLTDRAPRGGGTRSYEPGHVESVLRERFGSRTLWSPRTVAARQGLGMDPGASSTATLPAALAPLATVPRLRTADGRVVALVLTDPAPTTVHRAAEILDALGGAGIDVRTRVGQVVHSLLTRLVTAPGVLVFQRSEIGARALLAAVTDVVVVGEDDGTGLHRSVAEAAAAGARVLVPQPLRHDVPGAVPYTGPHDLLRTLAAAHPDGRPGRLPAGRADAPADGTVVGVWYRELLGHVGRTGDPAHPTGRTAPRETREP